VIAAAAGYVQAAGTGCIDYIFCSQANASVHFAVWTLDHSYIDSNQSTTSGQKDVYMEKIIDAAVNQVFNATISTHAYVSLAVSAITLNATAEAHPAIAVSGGIIPGTESRYSDFYTIEFSPGYWALGNPTPVQPSTWGKMKSHYLQH